MKATPTYWKLQYWSRASSNRACSLMWTPLSSGRQFSVASVARPEGLLGPTQGDVDAAVLATQEVRVNAAVSILHQCARHCARHCPAVCCCIISLPCRCMPHVAVTCARHNAAGVCINAIAGWHAIPRRPGCVLGVAAA